jgi:hypothetical protein
VYNFFVFRYLQDVEVQHINNYNTLSIKRYNTLSIPTVKEPEVSFTTYHHTYLLLINSYTFVQQMSKFEKLQRKGNVTPSVHLQTFVNVCKQCNITFEPTAAGSTLHTHKHCLQANVCGKMIANSVFANNACLV